ncbi:hypothetical protein MBM_06415 [Drepanopeziza brunnea f. sp. 'multigermtubi' MB_m1]|uniref:Uncharacterized protein n=1 Tax=Marssonina brunnea f. sp. multigermtubi (strain MB_m1) TaxID=1072389 RepID=K1XRJ6_MARBU|nr:uncharacterized protein MBM_06415 [Drepanopeziza brunnea f. sp. 'multigermtubi' MB_m1]EKD15199.1 hypothetical protein MBM_06415 [Drepanopeziza brunnea f. sp. 'multigermtubi' MB_m1]
MSPTSILRLAARQCARPPRFHAPKHLIAAPARPLSHSAIRAYPRKDSQDKDSIDTEATEYSKSGSDDAAARQEKAAFDPSTTDPQQEKEIAGAGNEESGNPLEVSPANPEVSKQRGQQEGGAESSPGKERQSGGGSPNKASKP